MRNKYIDGTYEQALAYGCDVVQLKYDGWWCQAQTDADGGTTFYSDTNRPFHDAVGGLPNSILIGEFMRGTQWSQDMLRKGKFFVFDIWQLQDLPLAQMSYRERMGQLRLRADKLPENFEIVTNFRISDYATVWSTCVETGKYEGVVFRRSVGPLGDMIFRKKRVLTFDGRVTGFVEGQGKHAGRLGALKVAYEHLGWLVETPLGTGFDDAEREAIWQHQTQYLGRIAEFEASAQFESGAVRHGRFVRWREDKS
jgi:ATP-dependent DNA ligase